MKLEQLLSDVLDRADPPGGFSLAFAAEGESDDEAVARIRKSAKVGSWTLLITPPDPLPPDDAEPETAQPEIAVPTPTPATQLVAEPAAVTEIDTGALYSTGLFLGWGPWIDAMRDAEARRRHLIAITDTDVFT